MYFNVPRIFTENNILLLMSSSNKYHSNVTS